MATDHDLGLECLRQVERRHNGTNIIRKQQPGAQEGDPPHAQIGSKCGDVELLVALDVRQVLGDGNHGGEHGDEEGDEDDGRAPLV